jgi:hypothetical protein
MSVRELVIGCAGLTFPALSNPRMRTFVSFFKNRFDHSVEKVTSLSCQS